MWGVGFVWIVPIASAVAPARVFRFSILFVTWGCYRQMYSVQSARVRKDSQAINRVWLRTADRPVHMGEVHATLFQHMDLDPNTTTISDLTGRPQYLVDGWKPLPELI